MADDIRARAPGRSLAALEAGDDPRVGRSPPRAAAVAVGEVVTRGPATGWPRKVRDLAETKGLRTSAGIVGVESLTANVLESCGAAVSPTRGTRRSSVASRGCSDGRSALRARDAD